MFGDYFNGTLIIPALWLGLWNGVYPIGGMLGSICSGYIQDHFGRRSCLFIGSSLTAICVGVTYVSDSPATADGRRGLFLFAKVLQGYSTGLVVGTTQTYMSENLPESLRGIFFALNPFFTLVGQVIGAITVQILLNVNGPQAYRSCFASQWPFSAVPLVLSLVMPESPAWLIRQQRLEDARKAFQSLGLAGNRNFQSEFEKMHQTVVSEMEKSGFKNGSTYAECFRGVNMRRTLVVIFAGLIPTAFGLPLLGSASYFFPILGMPVSTALTFIIIGAVLGIVANVISFWTLTRFGRRTLIIVSLEVSAIIWLACGIANMFRGPAIIWYDPLNFLKLICQSMLMLSCRLTAASFMSIIVTVGVGAWPASVVVSMEASSLKLRAKTLGIFGVTSNLISGGVSILLPYIYNPDSGNLGGKSTFIFGALCALSCAITWLAVPEMKGLTVEEIDEIFESRRSPRQV